ncbi:MAG: hypothetical protein ACRDIY_07220 [Chloroflexota bacterium]
MHAWRASWATEDVLWVALIGAIILGLTVGDGLTAAIAISSAGTVLGQVARAIHALATEYWLAAFPVLGFAGFRFVALARD